MVSLFECFFASNAFKDKFFAFVCKAVKLKAIEILSKNTYLSISSSFSFSLYGNDINVILLSSSLSNLNMTYGIFAIALREFGRNSGNDKDHFFLFLMRQWHWCHFLVFFIKSSCWHLIFISIQHFVLTFKSSLSKYTHTIVALPKHFKDQKIKGETLIDSLWLQLWILFHRSSMW